MRLLLLTLILAAGAGCAARQQAAVEPESAGAQESSSAEPERVADEAGPPIENLDLVDTIGQRKDGGVDLVIVAGPLTAEPEVQKLLLDKVEAYLTYINSDEFKAEFEHPPAEKTVIIISCYGAVDPVIVELVEKMKPWVEENNARIRIEQAEGAQDEKTDGGG